VGRDLPHRPPPPPILPESRRYLRGYAWLTVCPREIAERLGGADALRATGAFTEVAALRNGGVWLLAAPTLAEYDMPAAARIWDVLAPALRPGTPVVCEDHGPADRLVIEDAAARGARSNAPSASHTSRADTAVTARPSDDAAFAPTPTQSSLIPPGLTSRQGRPTVDPDSIQVFITFTGGPADGASQYIPVVRYRASGQIAKDRAGQDATQFVPVD
jgi:hypothetical protein